jgi:hypothetical protein
MFSASENKQEQQTFCGDVFFPLTENENYNDHYYFVIREYYRGRHFLKYFLELLKVHTNVHLSSWVQKKSLTIELN